MFLDSTKKLIAVLTAAKTTLDMPIKIDYVDITATTTTPAPFFSYTNGVTAVDILAAPAASTIRKVNGLTVYGRDTAAKNVQVYSADAPLTAGTFVTGKPYQIAVPGSTDFTLIGAANSTAETIFTATGAGTGTGTAYPLYQEIDMTLQIDDTLCYTDTQGWYTVDSQGNLKAVQAASATSIANAITSSTEKVTPVAADKVGIVDSVSGLLNWSSFTDLLNFFAAKLGNAANVFSVALGTAAAHAARVDQVSLYPTVNSAAAPDIFAAAGATINLDNSTPVTTTSFAACTSAQVGSVKRVIPAQNWTVTASASLHVDGATAGNIVMPAGAKLDVFASSTTTFEITTIFASGTWSPAMSGVTQVGATSNEFNFIKRGNEYSFYIVLKAATSTALTAGTGYIPGPAVPVGNKFSNCLAGNRNTALAIGAGTIDYTGDIYPPTISVGANVNVIITGTVRV